MEIYQEILVLRGLKRSLLLNFRAVTARSVSSPTKTPSCVLLVPRGHTCLGMTKSTFQYYLKHPEIGWTCAFCALPKLDDSFFVDKSIEDILSATSTGSEELNTTSSSTTSNELPTVWYGKHINGYYKHNLAIGYLNVNRILGKVDEVLDLLTNCRFAILFKSEIKIDKSVRSSPLSSPHYRIIRRERKHGAGGLLAYIHTSVIARRQSRIEPENVESICLSVKGTLSYLSQSSQQHRKILAFI